MGVLFKAGHSEGVRTDTPASSVQRAAVDVPPLKWSGDYHRLAIEEEALDAQETAFGRGDHRQAA
jgi:hypothetical protein